MRYLLIGFSALPFFTATANAQQWEAISGGADFAEYVDVSDIRRSGDEVRVWRERRFDRPQGPTKWYDVTRKLSLIDCAEGSVRDLQLHAYLQGRYVGTAPADNQVLYPPPGSVAAGVIRSVCSM